MLNAAPPPMLPGETLGHYRAVSAAVKSTRQDEAWAAGLVESFPLSWCGRLMDAYRQQHRAASLEDAAPPEPGHAAYSPVANVNLRHLASCRTIARAQRAGLRADANAAELRDEADKSARDAVRRMEHASLMARAAAGGAAAVASPPVLLTSQLWALEDWLTARGLPDAWDRVARCSKSGAAVLRRLADPLTWRRILKRLHAVAVEGTARTLGLVHKRAGIYVSNDALARRRGDKAHAARVLQSVVCVNDSGQEAALAELAAKGPANAPIRRMELMTRIAGFETIAKQCAHDAYFLTVTTPSRMHAWRTEGPRVGPNPKHDGTKPDEANRFLGRQWNKALQHLRRWGVEVYGFRIAEPNHDATPHWHALLFLPPTVARGLVKVNRYSGRRVAGRLLLRTLRSYFLWAADPGERGARRHRVTAERIDWARGSAAGYVAKYVSKNIDGYKVEQDLYGNDTLTSSQRVEAWASTWRIRQFQQVGGAPVGVWRELRRLHPDQAAAGVVVGMAVEAVNLAKLAPAGASEGLQQHTAATAWAAYTELQGGWAVKRRALRVRILREQSGELGRFGELMAPRPVGVETVEHRRGQVVPAFGILRHAMELHSRSIVIESETERASWIVVDGARELAPDGEWRYRPGAARRVADAKARFLPRGEAAGPWSPVNNSTRAEPAPLFGRAIERHAKRGKWFDWDNLKPNGGVHTTWSPHGPPDPDPDPRNDRLPSHQR